MSERMYKAALGGLLSGIGKTMPKEVKTVEYLQKHKITDPDLTAAITCHSLSELDKKNLSKDSIAYAVYAADRIALAVDHAGEYSGESVIHHAVGSIYNHLGEKQTHEFYDVGPLSDTLNVSTTTPDKGSAVFHERNLERIGKYLDGASLLGNSLNCLTGLLEETWTYVPADASDITDITLYDHSKITAALASCIEAYLQEKGETDYRSNLSEGLEDFRKEDVFYLYHMDVSGIQKFIYTITSKGALKTLRARSFYILLILEYLSDELESRLDLTRANTLYCGGGQAYLLLPNTKKTKKTVEEFCTEINAWMMENFGTGLYIAAGGTGLSADTFIDIPEKSYSGAFRRISEEISKKKLSRYTAEEILKLNSGEHAEGERECSVCHRVTKIKDDCCNLCNILKKLSKSIQNKDYFCVMKEPDGDNCLSLPGGRYLVAINENRLAEIQKSDDFVRCYAKNAEMAETKNATNFWVGDYQFGDDFKDLSDSAHGIERLAVFRADIDNLGQAFVGGFKAPYTSLTRTAMLSRKLAWFFQRYINTILKNEKEGDSRKATIVYSGGDDVFIIGAWDEVFRIAVDLHDEFKTYTQGKMTFSAGIALFRPKYPVSSMARETGELEDAAKSYKAEGSEEATKNAVCLFEEGNEFSWIEYKEKILGEKYELLENFFGSDTERGKAFLYKLLELIRNQEEEEAKGNGDRMNIARFAYLLARMRPNDSRSDKAKMYNEFAEKMYDWMGKAKDRRELIMAIYIYVYGIRLKIEEKED